MEEKNNVWNKLYHNYIEKEYKNWDQYFYIKMRLKKKFLQQVLKYSKNNKPILECGSGTGKFSVYLASLGLNVYAMDLESAMVEQAKRLSDKISPKNPVKVIKGNIKNIPFSDKYFSVTHSSGVLEHYNNSEIVNLINEQLRVSDVCIFSVPSPYFDKKMLGNERFMQKSEWRKIILQSKSIIIKETGYHYKTLSKRIFDIIKNPKKLLKPIALYVFVLKGKEVKNDIHN